MISGYFISVLGLAMFFPAAVDIYTTHSNWSLFITSSIISIFIGFSLFLANNVHIKDISLRQGYLLTSLSWFSVTILAAVPFSLYGTPWADAIFEAASGLSTTGATIYANVEALPNSILLWRSLLNSLGGVGIVIFAIAMLPFLGIGGMQVFQRENSDINDKFMPKISYIARRIIIVYVTLNVLCAIFLKMAGMSWFDAINHAMATIATGGLSTKNNSIGFFNSASIDMVVTLFMILGAIPLTLYHSLLVTRDIHSLRIAQAVTFLKVLFIYILFMACWLTYNQEYSFWQSMRYSAFNVTSIVTSTGFSSTDYMKWGPFVGSAFLLFALTGGCTGSTSGSIKIFRWQVVFAYLKKSFITIIEPHRIMPAKIGRITIGNEIISSVFIFLSAYSISIIVLTLLVAITGQDFETSFSAVIACITNSGPGIGKIVGPAGNYSSLSDFAKWTLAFSMLLGRLEVMTILVVFSKNFWRH